MFLRIACLRGNFLFELSWPGFTVPKYFIIKNRQFIVRSVQHLFRVGVGWLLKGILELRDEFVMTSFLLL